MIKKRILILNWKDIKNPLSGGAEVLTHELAKGLIKNGYDVLMFVSYFDGAKPEETIDGIKIVRQGKLDIRYFHNSVHYKAYQYYKKYLQGKIDLIIDEVHGVPFFAPFYANEKVIALICEVAGTIWFRMFKFPWNVVGWTTEQLYLRLYRKIPILAISDSQKKELIACGIPKKNITVLPMGFNRVTITKTRKEFKPTIIFVGRLNKMKGIEDAIQAVSLARKKYKTIQLWIVGRGEKIYVEYLKNLAFEKGISDSVVFWEFVTESKKFELMARAHAIVVPSLREGFGLIVPEAGSVGTPAVVYDVHGLRDTVKNGVNGFRVPRSHVALAKGIETILASKKKYRNLCLAARKESEIYTWENTAKAAIKIIQT